MGFELSNELTVFAAYHDRYLKMVGVNETGGQESRYKTKTEEIITFGDVKQAWESPSGIGHFYQVKDISSTCSGSLMQ